MAKERLTIVVDAVTGAAKGDFRALGAEAQKLGVTTQQSQGKVSGAFQKMGLSAGMMQAAAIGALAVAGTAVVGFAKNSMKAYTDTTDQVRRFAQVSGATADESSRWIAVFDDYGIAGDKVAKAVGRLAREAAGTPEKLEAFGVAVERNKDGSVDLGETLLNVADAYKGMNDPAERAALLAEAFGAKIGQSLIPVLEQGREGILKLFEAVPGGQLFNEKDLQAALDYKLAMDNLDDAVKELQFSLASALAPALTGLANFMADAVRESSNLYERLVDLKSNDWFGPLAWSMRDWLSMWKEKLRPPWVDASADIAALADEAAYATTFEERLIEKQAQLNALSNAGKEGTKEYAQALGEYNVLVVNAALANEELGTKQQTLALLSSGLTAEQAEQNATIQQQIEKYQVLAATADLLTGSSLGLWGAQINLKSAVEEYTRVQGDAGASDLQREQSSYNLALSAIEVAKRQGEATAATYGAQAGHQAQIDTLTALAGYMDGPAKQAVLDYIAQLEAIPPTKNTTVTADTAEAERRLRALRDLIDDVSGGWGVPSPWWGRQQTGGVVGRQLQTGGLLRAQAGRMIPTLVGEVGPEIALLPTGTRVLSHSESMRALSAPKVAVAGGGGGTVINVHIGGSVVTERQLVDSVHEALLRKQRQSGSLRFN